MGERLIEISGSPICPRCGWDKFDDWWHNLRQRRGQQPGGHLKCGACDKLFFIEGIPGNVFSSCHGVRSKERKP